ncbi:DUF4377 domain-containing protein [Lacinutrix jangbogonensis]|uniref:DUF4377 domain-containing protein n=1 Tax=Lacinutrix jangbogonensis TaxID=1469557 RepID=UPI0009E0729B|nr:DUF4377 domain-containing protein [Lacinutrix jangbogonensis]
MNYIIIILFTFISMSLNGQTTTNKNVIIDPYLSFQNYEHFKRLTFSSPDSSIEYLDRFEFAWGYRYKLSVKRTALKQPLSDGTTFDYSLNKVVSKTKMPDSTQFKLYLDPNRYYTNLDPGNEEMNVTLKPIGNNTFLYFDKVEIEVPENLTKKFDFILKGNATMGTFIFINDKRIKLIHL